MLAGRDRITVQRAPLDDIGFRAWRATVRRPLQRSSEQV